MEQIYFYHQVAPIGVQSKHNQNPAILQPLTYHFDSLTSSITDPDCVEVKAQLNVRSFQFHTW